MSLAYGWDYNRLQNYATATECPGDSQLQPLPSGSFGLLVALVLLVTCLLSAVGVWSLCRKHSEARCSRPLLCAETKEGVDI